MPYASVVLDIPTRALDAAFDYAVPPELAAEAVVGATVLVTFANRAAVGYVVATHDEAPAGVAAEKIRAIEQVLAPSAFDDASARVAGLGCAARWCARYARLPACRPSSQTVTSRSGTPRACGR